MTHAHSSLALSGALAVPHSASLQPLQIGSALVLLGLLLFAAEPSWALRLDDAPEADEVSLIEVRGFCDQSKGVAAGLERCRELMARSCADFGSLYRPYVQSLNDAKEADGVDQAEMLRQYRELETQRKKRGCALSLGGIRIQYLVDFWLAYGEWDQKDYGKFRKDLERLKQEYVRNEDARDFMDKAMALLNQTEQEEKSAQQARQKARQQSHASSSGGGGSARQCKDLWQQCWSFCNDFMSEHPGDSEWSSANERCVWRCGDAQSACERNDSKAANTSLCEAQCEGLRDDNGGLLSSSTREKCKSDCYFKYN